MVSKMMLAPRGRAARVVDLRHCPRAVGVGGRPGRSAGAVGDGREVGRVLDVVVEWAGEALSGAAPAWWCARSTAGVRRRVGRRRSRRRRDVTLTSSRLDVRDFEARPGEVRLMADVVDHQLVDIDGVQVVRAADLYLARRRRCAGGWSASRPVRWCAAAPPRSPARWRARATPERVIDWADVQPSADLGTVRLERAQPGAAPTAARRCRRPPRGARPAAAPASWSARSTSTWPPTRWRRWTSTRADRLLRQLDAGAGGGDRRRDGARRGRRGAARAARRGSRRRCWRTLPDEVRAASTRLLGLADDGTAGGIMTTVAGAGREGERGRDGARPSAGARCPPRRHRRRRSSVDADGSTARRRLRCSSSPSPTPARTVGELVGPPWPIVVRAADAASTRSSTRCCPTDAARSSSSTTRAGRWGAILIDDVLDAARAAPRPRPPRRAVEQ